MHDRLVNFRIKDVYYPAPHELLLSLHAEDILQGTVVDISNGGREQDRFVVVHVPGISQPVVVPIQHLQEVNRNPGPMGEESEP